MDISKKKINIIIEILIFLFFIIFPYGQLLNIKIKLFSNELRVHLIDILASLSIPLVIIGKNKYPNYIKHFKAFIIVSLFSLVFSLIYFSFAKVLRGSLYLLRVLIYSFFSIMIWNYVRENKNRKLIFKGMIIATIFIGIFGWVQYLSLPDLRGLLYLGWDNHYYRLVGTFLDPGFTSILLVLGLLSSFYLYLFKKNKKYLIISLFLLITLSFTYARASFIALTAALLGAFLIKGRKKISLWPIIILFILIPFLPRPGGEGVRLERFQSMYNKYGNYAQTFEVIKQHPVFGVGFNNICSARIHLFENEMYESHACSGSDSSILLILATTGTIGLLIFIDFVFKTIKSTKINNIYGITFISSAIAVFIHSLFVNSMFYPWVMGYMGILMALSEPYKEYFKLREDSE